MPITSFILPHFRQFSCKFKVNKYICTYSLYLYIQCLRYLKIFDYTGTLFSMKTVASHFRSTQRTMNNVCVSFQACLQIRNKTFSALFFWNIVGKNRILTARRWIKHMDSGSQQNGTAAIDALSAVPRDTLSDVMMGCVR